MADISLLPQLSKVLGVTTDAILSGKEDEVKILPAEQRKSLDELILRIKVLSHDGDKVRVNLPMSLVQVSLEIGMDFAGAAGGGDAVKNMDWQKIMDLVQRGVIGKLVEVESSDGDTVEIVVE